jgi:hypothetical protein
MRLASVLNDQQVELPGQRHDRIHITHLAIEVDWNDGPNTLAAGSVDDLPIGIPIALGMQVVPETIRVHIACPLIDIDELRRGSGLQYRLNRRYKRIGDRDNDVVCLDACRDQCESKRICPTPNTDTLRDTTKLGEILLEAFNYGSTDESCRANDASDCVG